ncbi:HK97 family phage prohead protease [Algoriphagus sp. 4150]|uniref:HK97 family phage prohead protease n=1 Tax=Algoriphagus sp. 4150 TaxID=2817756 RepID=UPI002860AC39|nr:HK97 family phage prohead protease [Algoriphagus sp. 4150]MDR7130695.1 HK97 family phage prohead protease [Algoriphagus sp. 4150]
MNKEIRIFSSPEFRAYEDGDDKYIEGYALTYNNESKNLGGFVEIIDNNSINENTDISDVMCLFNHKDEYILARNTSKTLEIINDEKGLYYKAKLDMNITYHKDLYLSIQRGDINKSSFAFYLPQDGSGEKWEKIGDKYIRRITQFRIISDVSPVSNAAYQNTTSMVRSFEEVKKELEEEIVAESKEEVKENNVNEYMHKYITLIK